MPDCHMTIYGTTTTALAVFCGPEMQRGRRLLLPLQTHGYPGELEHEQSSSWHHASWS
jgi:hypothetical protein